ncbi:UNVERIFIED_CONTAM: Acetylserotonin O-methyltransferase [Sesamum calycinum]|uniref:Acetylserotonin O-methyltransferase n=1 Tax=Sesamum calycinum TaxID=2727403 RepID=A0AAW2JQC5_9LAMI
MEMKSVKQVDEEAQARLEIWNYVFGFTPMAVMKCAIELRIADVLESHGGPMTLSQLSAALACSSSVLHRIMRTPLSRLLISNGGNSMAAFVSWKQPVMLAPWHKLSASALMNGTSAFEAAHGEHVWLACQQLSINVEAFNGIRSLVNVGGGDGTALHVLVKACLWIRGINFDLPHVVSVAPKCDEDRGKVIIAEAVMEDELGEDEDKYRDARLALDMVILTHTEKGKERSMREWEYVVNGAGFTRFTVKRIEDIVSVLRRIHDSITLPLKHALSVLHDWGNDECIDILRKCREAKVVHWIDEGEEDKYMDVRLALDMVMLAHIEKGTIEKWEYVVKANGFTRFTLHSETLIQVAVLFGFLKWVITAMAFEERRVGTNIMGKCPTSVSERG